MKNQQDTEWRSTALEITLERTKTIVEIPEKYAKLIDIAKTLWVAKRTEGASCRT
jgi:hypothetical protein